MRSVPRAATGQPRREAGASAAPLVLCGVIGALGGLQGGALASSNVNQAAPFGAGSLVCKVAGSNLRSRVPASIGLEAEMSLALHKMFDRTRKEHVNSSWPSCSMCECSLRPSARRRRRFK